MTAWDTNYFCGGNTRPLALQCAYCTVFGLPKWVSVPRAPFVQPEIRSYDHVPVSRGYMRAQYPLLMAFVHPPPCLSYLCSENGRTPPPCISYALVQATVGVGTVIIVYVILITYEM